MTTVNVLVTLAVAPERVQQIQAVDKRVCVHTLTQAERLVFRGGRPARVGPDGSPPQERPEAVAAAERTLKEALARAEVLVTQPVVPADLLQLAPRLHWIQITATGVDRLLDSDIVRRVTVTSAAGSHAIPIAEYVIGVMVMFAMGWPRLFRDQLAHRWRPFRPAELYGKTVGIVGMGHIGTEVARLAMALGMRVIGTRRSVTSRTRESSGYELLPPTDLHDLLRESDFVVIATPLTKETYHLIGEAELRVMKNSAYLINIARGAIIDEPVLIRALQEQWIAGAGLDVFEQEPLPPDSPLWDLENVIISPHHSGFSDATLERAFDLFCENLRRYLAGEPLLNVVDPERGY